jgi:hypothetical protein
LEPGGPRSRYGDTASSQAIPGLGDFVFLNERPQAELPLIALHTNPHGRHLTLQVQSLEALRTFDANTRNRGIPVSMALNHRVSISVCFHDPEGNMVEVFWATGRKDTDRPYAHPTTPDDLERPEGELRDRGPSRHGTMRMLVRPNTDGSLTAGFDGRDR